MQHGDCAITVGYLPYDILVFFGFFCYLFQFLLMLFPTSFPFTEIQAR